MVITLFSFKLKSHPDMLLKDHLQNVAILSKQIISYKSFENNEFFSEIAYRIGFCHDFGKSTSFFQNILDEKRQNTKYAYHSPISSIFGYFVIYKYLKKINKLDEFWYIPIIGWIVINKHHGDLINIGDETFIDNLSDSKEICKKQIDDIRKNNLNEVKMIYKDILEIEELEEFFNKFDEIIEQIRNDGIKISRDNKIDYYFYILFFYSVLLDADKLNASKTSLPPREKISLEIVERYKRKEFSSESFSDINSIREKAYKEVLNELDNVNILNERILSINLPTGIGKTLIGLAVALKLREKIVNNFGYEPRIIYSLPFLSIIDQTGEIIEKMIKNINNMNTIPSNLYLKHHHLSDIFYKMKENEEITLIEDINKSLILTEGWNSEIILTTFVQLFHSLITNRNRAARKFHNIINSIIILDEVQSIPQKYWLLLNEVFKYLTKKFNSWVILVTATEPLIFKEDEIRSLVRNREYYFKSFDRYSINLDLNPKELKIFYDELIYKILNNKNKDIMIVVNTIEESKKIYEHIKLAISSKLEGKLDGDGIWKSKDLEIIYLSTNILPFIRLRRIERIKNDKIQKIIITTQLIEAGVDISADIVYRDLAPLDCIIQTAGRCNRNNLNRGDLNVVRLINDKDKSREYNSYVYDSTLIDATINLLEGLGYSNILEKDFSLNTGKKYYQLIKERTNVNNSLDILNSLKNLKFEKLSEFKLIIEDNSSIFVEFDEKAIEIRQKIEEITKEKSRFERRNALLEIKKEMNEYTLSVRNYKVDLFKTLPYIGSIEDYKYIPYSELNKWYKLDVGLDAFSDEKFSGVI